MKIIYFGTPEFAVEPLEILSKTPNIEILAVVSQPDKAQGRKQLLTAPPVKTMAGSLNLRIIQPTNNKTLGAELNEFKDVDFFVVTAFGMILRKSILEVPKFGAINIHASLLPNYRGASPIQECLLRGDEETGISFMKMDSKMDHGDIFLIRRLSIDKSDNTETLGNKLSKLAAEILPSVLHDIFNDTLKPIPQNHEKATYCHKINKTDGKIDFHKSALEIQNMIRAYTPWPGAFTEIKGKKLQIIDAEISKEQLKPGLLQLENKILKIGTSDGCILPTLIKLEGKNSMDISSFINGYKNLIES